MQLFCGETDFQHALPLDRSSMTRWRQRIGPERLELLLAESLAAAQRGGAVEEKHLRRVTIDTTVMPKAATHPTDSKLLHRGIEVLVRLARRHGIRLRQSYLRVAKRAKREAAKLIHSGRRRRAERQVRQLRTWLGRLFRDIGRKIAGDTATEAAFAGPLGLIARLLRQRREARRMGGGPPPAIRGETEAALKRMLSGNDNHLTLAECRDRLAEATGVRVHLWTVGRALRRLKWT